MLLGSTILTNNSTRENHFLSWTRINLIQKRADWEGLSYHQLCLGLLPRLDYLVFLLSQIRTTVFLTSRPDWVAGISSKVLKLLSHVQLGDRAIELLSCYNLWRRTTSCTWLRSALPEKGLLNRVSFQFLMATDREGVLSSTLLSRIVTRTSL